jgi:hypothetical protein
MNRFKSFRVVHIAGTLWFMLCAGGILTIALRRAGLSWWLIFSISGHSALLVLLLISLYLFAIFRGVAKSHDIELEHPLTSTVYYRFFYMTTPFLGGFAGLLATVGADSGSQYFTGISMGTFGMTFLVWVVVDPAAGLLEMLVPSSRRHYNMRSIKAKARKARQQEKHRLLLESFKLRGQENRHQWREELEPNAEKLAFLVAAKTTDRSLNCQQAIDIGVSAWKLGGLICMRELHDMAMAKYKELNPDASQADYISSWWDGIGTWRSSLLC